MTKHYLAVLSLAALLAAAPASGVPSPVNSSVDACVVSTFLSSNVLHVVVRDFASNPIVGSYVTVNLANCPTAQFCTPPCTSCAYDQANKSVSRVTDASGATSFDLRIAGTCASGQVWVLADGVLLAQRALASADQDESGSVTDADVALVHARLGTNYPPADFDCSGTVDSGDEAFVAGLLRTSCDAPTPARPDSWGSVKIRYR